MASFLGTSGNSTDASSPWSDWSWDSRGFWISSRYGPSGRLEYDYKYSEIPGNNPSRNDSPPNFPRKALEEPNDMALSDSFSLSQRFQDLSPYDSEYRIDKGPSSKTFQNEYQISNVSGAQCSLDMGRTQGYEQIDQPSHFFRLGRVFKTPWTEPAGNVTDVEGPLLIQSLGSTFFTKIRHFVVVREKHGCSLCLALFTHNGQGAAKSGIDQDDYAAVFPAGGEPQIAPNERMTKKSFAIIVEHPRESIHPMSRLNFARVYTVEHNVKVLKVGRIVNEDLARLNWYFVSSNNLEISSNTSVDIITSGSQNSASNSESTIYPPTSSPIQSSLQIPHSTYLPSKHDTECIPNLVPAHQNTPPQAPSPPLGVTATRYSPTPARLEEDDRMKVISPKQQLKFWRVGRVFMCLWSEPSGIRIVPAGTSSSGSHFSATYLNGTAYTEIRRFVVIGEGYGNSICSPIYTYGGQATLKPNLPDVQQHAIIHTSRQPPPEKFSYDDTGTLVKENLEKEPIRVINEQADEEGDLGAFSRINYSKIYTVEHYVRVLNIGKVHPMSMASLEKNSFFNRRANEPPQPPRGNSSKASSKGSKSSSSKRGGSSKSSRKGQETSNG